MRDVHVRMQLKKRLATSFAHDPTTLILDELGIAQGQVRADVVVVNGALHGYEIKAACDSLSRLPRQVDFYGRVFDFASLVVAEKHLSAALQVVPDWWGVYQVCGSEELELLERRGPQSNPNQDIRCVSQLLWRDEALALLVSRQAAKGILTKPRRYAWDAVCEVFSASEIRDAVRQRLKERADQRPLQQPAGEPAQGGVSSQFAAKPKLTRSRPS